MKAVQIVNPSEMKVVELEKPTVGVGEVLVRIKYVGFCGSDLNTFLGRNPMVKLPVIPGHEVGAVIEEIGPNVPAGFEKGMNVTLNPSNSVLHKLLCFPNHYFRKCSKIVVRNWICSKLNYHFHRVG